ncbi:MarR family transcriptional regulator [Streptosporangium sp. NPDC049248]|uniref:MarR family winged helix-turn-helix transcriptional regulator n=1 Tax=Streptosporangium sp. NPDC049248 TaxID=3155651 RepID=UPI00344253DF
MEDGYSLLDSTMYAMLVRLGSHKRQIAAGLEELGLRLGQELYLALLWREDGLSQSALAGQAKVSAANVTQVLHGMERQGLVVRRRDDPDARIQRIWLTEAGRALESPVTEIWRAAETAWLSGLTPAQRRAVELLK